MRVVVSEFMDEAALDQFASGDSVLYAPDLVDDRAKLLATLADVDAVIVRNRTQVDAALLEAAPRLKAVGRLGVGLDNIDLAACAARDVAVLPATGANTGSVVEYVIGTMMALVRGAYASSEPMLDGAWPRGLLGKGGEIAGRRLGLIGFGAIARAVAAKARGLDMTVAAYDPFLDRDDPAWAGTQALSKDDILATSDVLSLHVPLTEETTNLIDAAAIQRMKTGSVLINTARGGVVDEVALAEALRRGQLGGAALDVFATEPLTSETAAPFIDVPNLILTPHIAGVTDEGNTRVSVLTVQNVIKAVRDRIDA